MGTIIQFPDGLRASRDTRPSRQGEDATILILPSIRVERHSEASAGGLDPTSNNLPPRPGRRRGSR
jgi:hypothetical protein